MLRLGLLPQCSKDQLLNSNKQNLLKCKSIIQIATFNVRILNRIGQVLELRASAIDHNIDIVCVQEHRYHHSEKDIKYHNPGNGCTFVSSSTWKNSVNAVIGGVGGLISQRALKSLNSIEKIHQGRWYYLPTPPLGQDMTQGQFLSGV